MVNAGALENSQRHTVRTQYSLAHHMMMPLQFCLLFKLILLVLRMFIEHWPELLMAKSSQAAHVMDTHSFLKILSDSSVPLKS